ncbi:hypothetical protein MA16_Dca022894 [Dendrobium catenatum]|uniref:Uncharacterized protein n=1 Tax=Dendrobium catenatum TaxID=906689 RepID=A0A2I0VCP6_9ASPA|nr:hypothetical protein MA16_Dca022894 [Dendrobium catenatum]
MRSLIFSIHERNILGRTGRARNRRQTEPAAFASRSFVISARAEAKPSSSFPFLRSYVISAVSRGKVRNHRQTEHLMRTREPRPAEKLTCNIWIQSTSSMMSLGLPQLNFSRSVHHGIIDTESSLFKLCGVICNQMLYS